ncbi:phage neck terminator protein [Paraburkholderia elongata]|uniref:Phage neck terminator protein gp12-like domain-containing protein n=1 Tax=Paraburkholderia elongata TaxID=2675747 RepID=A0A972NWI6_9BURK|nr:hypothetical protein [Paraburkholderia elongata]NPT59102.1 hypothetical protein [Paraburkholderia elongata]
MSATLSLTEVQTLTALRNFLLAVLPANTEVIRGLDNRVPEPQGANFVEMTPILRDRLSTNVDSYTDAAFIGSIAGTTLTITSVSTGALTVGSVLLGNNLAANTVVTAFGTGTGGVGAYTVSPSQTVASQIIAAGVKSMLQPAKVTVQLDVHGPASADNAAIITTLFRDEYGVTAFASSGFDVTPLYTSDPRQMPFLNGEQQVEERYVVDAVMQTNPIVTVPQQFAAAVSLSGINDVA